MLAWFEGGPRALVVLGEVTGDRRYTWYSKERQSITTFGPYITAALGLEVELRNTIFSGGWRLNPLDLVGMKLTRSLDIVADKERVQVPLVSTFEAKGLETVEILGTKRQLRRVAETVESGGRRRHRNEYWIDPSTGRCWKSRQLAVPTLPPINFEVTKYPTV